MARAESGWLLHADRSSRSVVVGATGGGKRGVDLIQRLLGVEPLGQFGREEGVGGGGGGGSSSKGLLGSNWRG